MYKDKHFILLDRLEYELKTIWHKYNTTKDNTYLLLYKAKHKAYKNTKTRLLGS